MAEENDIRIENEDLDDSVVAEEHQRDAVKKLKEKLKESEAKTKEYLDELQRAKADFVNLRKRDEEERVQFVKYANVKLVEELIPALDALSASVEHDKGMAQTYNLFLKSLGLEEQNPLGESFDPNFHEAIGMIETGKKEEDHKVLEVVQKGYILSGKIIRPAKVRIGELKS